MPKEIDIKEFAKQVEDLCDFFLSRTPANGSADRKIVEDLKEDAADIQFKYDPLNTLAGLDQYVRGLPEPKKEL